MSQARTNSLLAPRTQPRIFAILTTGDLVIRTNVSIRIWRPEAPTAVSDVPSLAGQIKVGEVEVRICALEYDYTQARGGVHPNEQMLEGFEDGCVHDVKRRIVEYNPPVRKAFPRSVARASLV